MGQIVLKVNFNCDSDVKQIEEMVKINSDILNLHLFKEADLALFSEDFVLEFGDLLNIEEHLQTLLLFWEKKGFNKLLNVWIPVYEKSTGNIWNHSKGTLFVKALLFNDREGAQHIVSKYSVELEKSLLENSDLFVTDTKLVDKVFYLFERLIEHLDKHKSTIQPEDTKYKELFDAFFTWHENSKGFSPKYIRQLLSKALIANEKYLFEGLIRILKGKIKKRDMLTYSNFELFFPWRHMSELSKEFAYIEKENYIRISDNNWFLFRNRFGAEDDRIELVKKFKDEINV